MLAVARNRPPLTRACPPPTHTRATSPPHARVRSTDKAALAGAMLDIGKQTGGPTFAERLAMLFREAGLQPPQVTLEYRDLCVEADALVGSANMPSLSNTFNNALKRVTCQARGVPPGARGSRARLRPAARARCCLLACRAASKRPTSRS